MLIRTANDIHFRADLHAKPVVGDSYRQEYHQGMAEDVAAVLGLGERVTVPYGSYSDVLLTNEWSALEDPPAYEHKSYARGVGLILTESVDGDDKSELVEVRHE